jgi:hypothetical protein
MSNSSSSGGVGFLGMIAIFTFVVFLFLKLAGMGVVADWSWWWVTAPLWGYFVLIFGILIIAFLIMLIVGLFGLIAAAIFDR